MAATGDEVPKRFGWFLSYQEAEKFRSCMGWEDYFDVMTLPDEQEFTMIDLHDAHKVLQDNPDLRRGLENYANAYKGVKMDVTPVKISETDEGVKVNEG
jgi:hypothetical protein